LPTSYSLCGQLSVAAWPFAGIFWAWRGSHRLPEGSGCSLQPLADLPELLGRGVDALLLCIRALLLSVGSQAERVQPSVHLLHCPGEIRQLRGNARDVFSGGRSSPILGPNL